MHTFHRWGDLVFIIDDHDNFSNWMIIQIFIPLGEIFYFLIVNQLTIIRKYPTSLIGGDLIRDVGYFPLIQVLWMFTSPGSQMR